MPQLPRLSSDAPLRSLMCAIAFAVAGCAGFTSRAPMDTQQRAGVAAGTVSVSYDDPAKFSGAGRESADARLDWLGALCEYLADRSAAALPAGQRLEVHLTDVARAGNVAPGSGAHATAPRIELRFRRLAADGRVLASGARELIDPQWLSRRGAASSDPLRSEKALVDDWVANEFGTLR